MQQLMQGLYNIVTKIQPVTYLLVAIALVICGVMFIVPSEKSKEKAKGAIPWVLIGCGIIVGAMTLAQEISSSFVF
jgi:hypothetical protein